MTPSVSLAGNCYDAAVSKSFLATLKKELADANREIDAERASCDANWTEPAIVDI